jgi:glycosyltransferase involved in cell wall biosynthesis
MDESIYKTSDNVTQKVYVTVTNDLATDQRVLKVCRYLTRLGFDVTMVGALKPTSLAMPAEGFQSRRFSMIFRKSFLFYAEYNIRLFFYLLFRKADLYVSNDLDTLTACYLISRIKGKKLVYDSHEYFLGAAEIVDRPLVRKVWGTLERIIFPRLKHVFTVNHSIADLYEKQYGKRPLVVRNVPRAYRPAQQATRQQLGLPADKKIVLMQGGGINVDRGAEELIHAMLPHYGLKNVLLVFIGAGDRWNEIQQMVIELKLSDRITFIPRLPYDKMMSYTALCDLGISLDKPIGINYQLSLPNKLFDYIMAGLPVLTSPLTEVKKVVEEYQVGVCTENYDPAHIADKIKFMLEDADRYAFWKSNTEAAAKELCWENEEKVLDLVYLKLRQKK